MSRLWSSHLYPFVMMHGHVTDHCLTWAHTDTESISHTTRKMIGRNDSSSPNFCTCGYILFVQFTLFNSAATRWFKIRSKPIQCKLFVLLGHLLCCCMSSHWYDNSFFNTASLRCNDGRHGGRDNRMMMRTRGDDDGSRSRVSSR